MTGVLTCVLPFCFPVTILGLFPSHDKKETREEKAARESGENEVRGSRDAARALAPKVPRKDARKTKR